MADAGLDTVRLGVWSDHSRGRVLGSTLTLRNRDAAVLLAFLATLVSLAASRSWRLSRFILYQVFADRPAAGEDDPHAHEVLIRNSETAGGAGLSMLDLVLRRGRKATFVKTKVWKQAAIFGGAFCHWVFFIVAGVLTSQILLGRTVVSIVSPTCGKWKSNLTAGTDPEEIRVWQELELNQTLEADNYVQNCYSSLGSQGVLDCSKLETQAIPFNVEHNVPCPFPSSEICIGGSSKAFALDTGNISFTQLGINCAHCNELFVRKRSVCAPIDSKPFNLGRFTSANLSTIIPNGDDIFADDEDYAYVYSFTKNSTGQPDYHLVSLYRNLLLSAYEVTPVILNPDMDTMELNAPQFRFSDGSHGPSLILMSGLGVIFPKQSDDPFWSVHTQGNTPPGVAPLYRMDRMLNILGCDEQAQMCSSLSGKCTPMWGLLGKDKGMDHKVLAPDGGADEKQYWEIGLPAILVEWYLIDTTIISLVAGRDGNAVLQAARQMRVGRQNYLDAEQWKTELRHWFGMGLARLQLGIFHSIEIPQGIDAERATNQWSGDAATLRLLCGRVKYRSPAHTSLSFFGVMFVVFVSVLLVALSFFELALAGVLRKWLSEGRMERWDRAENLALLERRQDKADFPVTTVTTVHEDVKHETVP